MKVSDFVSSKYLSAVDLRERDVTVTIDHAEVAKMQNGEKKAALFFQGKAKAMLLNKTNLNTIAEVLGTDDLDAWEGGTITLYPTETDYAGKMVDCIRVRRKKASTAPQAPAMPASEPVFEDEPFDDGSAPF